MANRTKSLILALLVLVFAATFATRSFAQTPPPAPPQRPAAMQNLLRGPFRPIAMQLRGLRLTPEQRQRILGIFKSHQPEFKVFAEKQRAARAQWQQSGSIKIEERNALQAERQALMKTVRTEVVNVLTPEQQKQLQARRAHRAR